MTAPGAYWPRPWTCEDGGARRLGAPQGQAGLAIAPGERLELAAVRDAAATGMLIRREPGELFALRHELPRRAQGPPHGAQVAVLQCVPGVVEEALQFGVQTSVVVHGATVPRRALPAQRVLSRSGMPPRADGAGFAALV